MEDFDKEGVFDLDEAHRFVRQFFKGVKPLTDTELSALRVKLRPIFEIDSDAALVECLENFRKIKNEADDPKIKIKAESQIFAVLKEMEKTKRAQKAPGGVDPSDDHYRHLRPLFPKIDDPDAMCRAAALEIGKARADK